MRKALRSSLTTAAAAVGLLLAVASPAVAASPNAGTKGCSYVFNTNGVNIRTGHNTGATPVGQGQKGQGYFSFPFATGTGSGYTWIQGTDETTGKSGWVADQFLTLQSCHVFND